MASDSLSIPYLSVIGKLGAKKGCIADVGLGGEGSMDNDPVLFRGPDSFKLSYQSLHSEDDANLNVTNK
jgi:hypothetical protein